MQGETLWNEILEVLPASGEEIQTTTGLWFKASSNGSRLFIEKAEKNRPSSKLSALRSISKNDFLLVHSYYDRWVKREIGIRHEVSRRSRNTAYIFALIRRFIDLQ